MKTPCSLLLLLCCPLVLFCQTDRLRDSLLRRAQTADADTTRVWALMETGKLFLNTNADSALLYLRPALQLAEQTGFEKGMARCRINSAVAWFDLGQFDSVQTLCNGAIPLCERLGLRKELVAVYNLLGNTWSARENGWLAIRAFEKCLEVMKTAEVPPHYPIVVNDNISNLYLRLDLYAKGLEYARECARLAEANGDELTMCTAFIHIGNAYKGLEKPELALPVYEKSIQLARKNNYNRVLATALSAAAEIHANTGKESLAIDMYQEGLRVAQAGGDREGQMYNLHGLSLIELTQGQWAAAQRHADDAL
ncbi:MAG: tetratricopeptide repeat protein, partial [Saprospiraceae bacterium]|nr:tetratricopeptide repeat protein [Saprospiraceae bacterium]